MVKKITKKSQKKVATKKATKKVVSSKKCSIVVNGNFLQLAKHVEANIKKKQQDEMIKRKYHIMPA